MWKIQQKAYVNRNKLKNTAEYARKQRKKKRDKEKNRDKTNSSRKKNKAGPFQSFFRSIVPMITEM